MLVRLICLAFLGLFATSVAYALEDDTQSGKERQQPAELTALEGVLEAMNMGAKMGADSEGQAPDDIDNNDTDTDKDNATQSLSATTSESASASATTSESASDSAASPAAKPDPD